ncbi:uncharacterized protein LOC111051029 isoform X2 [Nilaparvata lugens]|uniref:uncharacterized protein LOC111051029 isoform X2 n=1 Tax=Nilaparvata lugens TaxID=108931 RepID=UPI00193CBACB|nr:uncharacterized protein LOC111051029 isoform X2 [Nilaparvata lugens]XP_039288036.1 uncharacterized protein LOC111051029 isoform X2 [Nilaparvata lugens]
MFGKVTCLLIILIGMGKPRYGVSNNESVMRFCSFGGCTGFHVELRMPRYVRWGEMVTLKCDYNVPPDLLHKVEWLRQGRKIFQYINGRTPPYRNYSIVGAQLDWSHSDSKQIVLRNLDFTASGVYSCEVTTDHPIYTKPSDDQELTIMQGQLEDPNITFQKPVYTVGEILEVNCTSGIAKPTPDVTWLLNGKQVDDSAIRTFPEQRPSQVTVQLSFEVKEEHRDQLELTCLATIPGFMGHHARHSQYADHRMATVSVEVIEAQKIVETSMLPPVLSSSARCELHFILAVILLFAVQCCWRY